MLNHNKRDRGGRGRHIWHIFWNVGPALMMRKNVFVFIHNSLFLLGMELNTFAQYFLLYRMNTVNEPTLFLLQGGYERILQWPVSRGYSGRRSRTVAIKCLWLTRLIQWLTPRNPDFQIFNTSHGYGTSATVQDSNTISISHCTRFQPLLYETSNTISMTGHWRILSYVPSIGWIFWGIGALINLLWGLITTL